MMALSIVANRIRNLSPPKSDREHCTCCQDDGMVVAQTRVDTYNGHSAVVEEYGPCPYCERGLKVEFAKDMPWSADGYWRGRDIPAHLTEPKTPDRPMTHREQKAALATVKAAVHWGATTVDSKIEPQPRLVTNETHDWAKDLQQPAFRPEDET